MCPIVLKTWSLSFERLQFRNFEILKRWNLETLRVRIFDFYLKECPPPLNIPPLHQPPTCGTRGNLDYFHGLFSGSSIFASVESLPRDQPRSDTTKVESVGSVCAGDMKLEIGIQPPAGWCFSFDVFQWFSWSFMVSSCILFFACFWMFGQRSLINLKGDALCRPPLLAPRGWHLGGLVPPFQDCWHTFWHLGSSWGTIWHPGTTLEDRGSSRMDSRSCLQDFIRFWDFGTRAY